MPRPLTKGLEYTFLDKNFFSDRKVKRLKRKCGDDSPYAFLALLCLITQEGYYIKYDSDSVYDIADMTGFDEDRVEQIVNTCGEVGLLDEGLMMTERVLTSHGIQKYYATTCAQLKRKTVVSEYSLLNDAVGGVSSEETLKNSENSEFLPKNEEETPTKEKKRKEEKYKEIKRNSSSSFIPSSSGDEELTPEEREKEKIVSFFTFTQNFRDPCYEYERLVAWNNNPQAKKKWDAFSEREKQSAALLWHPEKETVSDHVPRYGSAFLSMWQEVFKQLKVMDAPYEVRMSALSDRVRWDEKDDSLTLVIPDNLHVFLEENMDVFKPVIWPFLRSRGRSKLMYKKC